MDAAGVGLDVRALDERDVGVIVSLAAGDGPADRVGDRVEAVSQWFGRIRDSISGEIGIWGSPEALEARSVAHRRE